MSNRDYKKNRKSLQKVGRISGIFSLFFSFFLKISRERKLMRTRRVKGNGQKISRPAEIYELQLLPVCVLCCLMAAVVSDWQCANATHSVQTCQHREPGSEKLIIKNTKMKMHAPPCRGGVCRLDTLARTQEKNVKSSHLRCWLEWWRHGSVRLRSPRVSSCPCACACSYVHIF